MQSSAALFVTGPILYSESDENSSPNISSRDSSVASSPIDFGDLTFRKGASPKAEKQLKPTLNLHEVLDKTRKTRGDLLVRRVAESDRNRSIEATMEAEEETRKNNVEAMNESLDGTEWRNAKDRALAKKEMNEMKEKIAKVEDLARRISMAESRLEILERKRTNRGPLFEKINKNLKEMEEVKRQVGALEIRTLRTNETVRTDVETRREVARAMKALEGNLSTLVPLLTTSERLAAEELLESTRYLLPLYTGASDDSVEVDESDNGKERDSPKSDKEKFQMKSPVNEDRAASKPSTKPSLTLSLPSTPPPSSPAPPVAVTEPAKPPVVSPVKSMTANDIQRSDHEANSDPKSEESSKEGKADGSVSNESAGSVSTAESSKEGKVGGSVSNESTGSVSTAASIKSDSDGKENGANP